MNSVFLICLLPLALSSTLESPHGFHDDCADPHNKEVACTVYKISCDDELLDLVPSGQEPPEPHDLRIESFAKSLARLSGKHQLQVEMSWQMPPRNESAFLEAFKLSVEETNGTTSCFLFNVTEFELNNDRASPRFHFSSDSLFEFEREYSVTLYSLPHSKDQRRVQQKTTMPSDPEKEFDDPMNMTQYCQTHSHPEASRWTAGFRRIFLQSLAKTIQVIFVGAPAQFCFEQYEVRLLDETGIELLQHAIINAEDMKEEWIEGRLITFGEYNFTDLELEVDYIPSVIPVEMSHDGRCLCPTSAQHGACSCIAADWKKVRLHRIEAPLVINTTMPMIEKPIENNELFSVAYIVCVLLGALIVISCFVCAVIAFIRKYSNTKCKPTRIRFISDAVNGEATVCTETPLIFSQTTSILILYAHDCPLHEDVVLAFADLLTKVFKFEVHMDACDGAEIEQNLAEYINASVVRADKIIVVNSVGAFHRVRSRHLQEGTIMRRNGGPLDGLFNKQIDLALQHARVVSIRFSYTPAHYTLFALTPLLQYAVPENIGLLIASLNDSCQKSDTRLHGFSPEMSRLNAAVTRMTHFNQREPKWFEQFHVCVPNSPAPQAACSIDSGFESCSVGIRQPRLSIPNDSAPCEVTTCDESAMLLTAEQPPDIVNMAAPELRVKTPIGPDGTLDSSFYDSATMSDDVISPEIPDRPRIAEDDKLHQHDSGGDSGVHDTFDSSMFTEVQ